MCSAGALPSTSVPRGARAAPGPHSDPPLQVRHLLCGRVTSLAQPIRTAPHGPRLEVVASGPRRRRSPDLLATPAGRGTAVALLLGSTAALYVLGLPASGWGNAYYAAAAQAGARSWSAMLFGGLDPAGGITVDKPPAALWLMDVSVRLFGLSSWSVLLPQALCGVAAVALLYATVRRQALGLGLSPSPGRR